MTPVVVVDTLEEFNLTVVVNSSNSKVSRDCRGQLRTTQEHEYQDQIR